MTVQMNIAEAKAKLSELVARAEAGEEVIISRGGKVVAEIRPRVDLQDKRRRLLGSLSHLAPLHDPYLFLRPDPDLEDAADGPLFPAEE